MCYITLTPETLENSHICCAISDKKCLEGTRQKKEWLTEEYAHGWRFHRLDERAKVFVEYGPANTAWLPVEAPDAMMMGCFWVSGRYAKKGHGQALLAHVEGETRAAGLRQIATVAGQKKFHFMSDGRWLKRQGFTVADRTDTGFELLVLDLEQTPRPAFTTSALEGRPAEQNGVCVYYSARCPYTEFHITQSLHEACRAHGLALHIHKISSRAEARNAPSPATIFSLYLDGKFQTTDLSVCLPSRFDKLMACNS